MCGHEWLRRLFLHERQRFTHSVSVFVSTSFTLSLAACRASGSSLASSQEVKLNCRARLPNDERLRHPGMLWARTESSEREKMLAFQLNVFFPAFFFFGVSFSSIRVNVFFFLSSYTTTCTPALERELLVGDGWMDGVRRRIAKEWPETIWLCVHMCVYVSLWEGGAFSIIKWTKFLPYSTLYSVFFRSTSEALYFYIC